MWTEAHSDSKTRRRGQAGDNRWAEVGIAVGVVVGYFFGYVLSPKELITVKQ